MADSLRGGRPWVVDLMDGKGLGALESHAKMQLLIEVLKTRYTYTFKEATLVSIMPCIKGRLYLFEPRDEERSAPKKGFNQLALVFGLWCSGPVVVELVSAMTTA